MRAPSSYCCNKNSLPPPACVHAPIPVVRGNFPLTQQFTNNDFFVAASLPNQTIEKMQHILIEFPCICKWIVHRLKRYARGCGNGGEALGHGSHVNFFSSIFSRSLEHPPSSDVGYQGVRRFTPPIHQFHFLWCQKSMHLIIFEIAAESRARLISSIFDSNASDEGIYMCWLEHRVCERVHDSMLIAVLCAEHHGERSKRVHTQLPLTLALDCSVLVHRCSILSHHVKFSNLNFHLMAVGSMQFYRSFWDDRLSALDRKLHQ